MNLKPLLGPFFLPNFLADLMQKKISLEEQQKHIRLLDYVKVNGKVNLKNPKKRIWIMEDYYKFQSKTRKFKR